MSDEFEEDEFGNPKDGSRLINCCFPYCGCDGARLCHAENGASERACSENVEQMWSRGSDPRARKAVFSLMGSLKAEKKKS